MDAHAEHRGGGSGDTKPRGAVLGGNRSPSGSTRRDGHGRRRAAAAAATAGDASASARNSVDSGRSEKSFPPAAVDDDERNRLFSTPVL